MMSATRTPVDYLDKSYTGLRKVSTAPSLGRRANVRSADRQPFARGRSPSSSKGMVSTLLGGPGGSPSRFVVKTRSLSREPSESPVRDSHKEEAIKLAAYPSAKEPVDDEVVPIERDDWPAPPSPAVLIPQRLRERRESQGKSEVIEEDSVTDLRVDAQLNREIDEMAKLQDSPMAQVIREELSEEAQAQQKRLLNPRSASRVPAANKEPIRPHRFTSSVNASPSRNADRPKVISDSISPNSCKPVGRGSQSFFTIRPGNVSNGTSKSSTLPPGTPGAYVYESFYTNGEDDDDEAFVTSRPALSRLDRKALSLSANGDIGDLTRDPRMYKSTASTSVYGTLSATNINNNNNDANAKDPMKRESKYRHTSMSDRIAFLKSSSLWKPPSRTSSIYDGTPFTNAATLDLHRSSLFLALEEQILEPKQTFSYEVLKLDSGSRPKGLEEHRLEASEMT